VGPSPDINFSMLNVLYLFWHRHGVRACIAPGSSAPPAKIGPYRCSVLARRC
jgi:hypothetical protein